MKKTYYIGVLWSYPRVKFTDDVDTLDPEEKTVLKRQWTPSQMNSTAKLLADLGFEVCVDTASEFWEANTGTPVQ